MKKSLISPTKRLPHHLLTLVYLLALAIGVNGCKSSDPQPSTIMTLKMSADGKEWKATNFLIEVRPSDQVDDEHLWIDAYESTTINPSTHVSLYIYDYKKTGTSTVDNSKNNRQQNGNITFVDISKGTNVNYDGPITYTLTKVEGNHYQGAFSGKLCAYDCMTSVQPISVQGSFDVRIGIQAE